jgi:peptide/nickel transport system substrate-binding protein
MLAVTALVALACASAPGAAESRSAQGPTLVVDNSFALDTTDPQRAYDPTSSIIDRAVYDTLFTYRGDDLAHPIPLLVSSWSSSGGRSFTFRLKPNAHFADGTPLTSADVVFSLRRLVNLNGNPAHLLTGVLVSALDRYTVAVKSRAPLPQLPAILADPSTGIVNSELVKAHGGTDAGDASTADTAEQWFDSPGSAGAGSGPYEIQSYDPGSQVTLRANPDYWGTKKPAFPQIVIRNMIAASQFLNITRGSHQIALDLSSDQAEGLKHDAALRVSSQPSPWVFYAFTNDDAGVSKVTSNKSFQQAVRYALGYEGLAAVAGPGAIQAPGIIPSMVAGALPKGDALSQDLSRARADLAASGVGSQPVTLEYPNDLSINGVPFTTLAQKIQADLQAAGFNVALSGSPVTTFQPKFRAGKVAFGLWLFAFDYPDPANYQVFTPGNLIALHVGWSKSSDAALGRLATKALVTTAPAARESQYRRIQLGMNARGPFIPLIQPAQIFAATSDLSGAVFSGAYDVDLTRIAPA